MNIDRQVLHRENESQEIKIKVTRDQKMRIQKIKKRKWKE